MKDSGFSNFTINDDSVSISVNPEIYPLDVVLSSAYIFTERCYVLIDGDPKEELLVELRPKKKEDLELVARDFNNELVNYANYTVQTIRNQELRQAIISRVLMTNSVKKDLDPEDIAREWEDDKDQ